LRKEKYKFFFKTNNLKLKSENKLKQDSSLKNFLDKELNFGLYKKDIYNNLFSKINFEKNKLLDFLNKQKNIKLIAFGASITCITLMYQFNLQNKILSLNDDNKIKDGILFTLFDENLYPYLNIELGQELAINFLNKFFIGSTKQIINEDILDLIYNFGRIFYYKTAKIFHEYKPFTIFEKNYSESDKIFLETNLFNKSIYDYLKSNIKILINNPFIEYPIGYWYLDEYFNKPVDQEIINKYNLNHKTNKELLIDIVENKFNLYLKIINIMPVFNNPFIIFNIYEKLVAEGLIDLFKPNLEYTNDDNIDDNFKLIFRQPIRRY
jgi:hypothetical protein